MIIPLGNVFKSEIEKKGSVFAMLTGVKEVCLSIWEKYFNVLLII